MNPITDEGGQQLSEKLQAKPRNPKSYITVEKSIDRYIATRFTRDITGEYYRSAQLIPVHKQTKYETIIEARDWAKKLELPYYHYRKRPIQRHCTYCGETVICIGEIEHKAFNDKHWQCQDDYHQAVAVEHQTVEQHRKMHLLKGAGFTDEQITVLLEVFDA